jgi:hypothetical protein
MGSVHHLKKIKLEKISAWCADGKAYGKNPQAAFVEFERSKKIKLEKKELQQQIKELHKSLENCEATLKKEKLCNMQEKDFLSEQNANLLKKNEQLSIQNAVLNRKLRQLDLRLLSPGEYDSNILFAMALLKCTAFDAHTWLKQLGINVGPDSNAFKIENDILKWIEKHAKWLT